MKKVTLNDDNQIPVFGLGTWLVSNIIMLILKKQDKSRIVT